MLRTYALYSTLIVVVSDHLLSDMLRTFSFNKSAQHYVSGRLLSDKRKHPLTALIGNEGMFFYLGVDNV